ncbi:MAG: IPT/TIG domain-containing protein [Bacteroidales bacterium]|jgi:N-acetylneuraminic acid mutarotase|nr:IPT/TIG domain-containing protein [Bacteroidales bacterium]
MKITYNNIIALSVFVLLLSGCTEEAERDFPRLRTLNASNITSDGATLRAEILNSQDFNITECGFYIYKGEPSGNTLTSQVICEFDEDRAMFEINIGTGLEEGTEYYYRAFASSGPLSNIGNTCSFVSKGSKVSEALDFNPSTGQVLDTITILLDEYTGGSSGYEIQLSGITADIVACMNNELKVIVPPSLVSKESPVTIHTVEGVQELVKQFSLISPVINSFTPDTVYPLDIVTIRGTDFHRISSYNVVTFNGVPAEILVTSETEIMVRAPYLDNQDCTISVSVSGQTATAQNTIYFPEIFPAWERVADFPGGESYKSGAFAIGNYGYAGLGTRLHHDHIDAIWKYDPSQDIWSQTATFPGQTSVLPFAFSIAGTGYIGGGFTQDSPLREVMTDFYSYEAGTDSWDILADYDGPTDNSFMSTGTVCNDRFYIPMTPNDLYMYEPDSWTKVITSSPVFYLHSSTFAIGNSIFFICGVDDAYTGSAKSDVWCYNTITNTWSRKNDFPGEARYVATGFSINGKGFIGLGQKNPSTFYRDFWLYDPLYDSWTRLPDFPGSARTCAFSFVINGLAYIGTGHEGSGLCSDIYVFNPAGR